MSKLAERLRSKPAGNWVPVCGYEGFYEVSDGGAVFSLMTGRVLSPSIVEGYPRVTLYKNGSKRNENIHRIVLVSFSGLPESGKQVAHNNGDRLDCRLSNLRWATIRENAADRAIHGTAIIGRNCHAAKLFEADVLAIRQSQYLVRQIDLAKQYGVARSTIHRIQHGTAWSHVSTNTALARLEGK